MKVLKFIAVLFFCLWAFSFIYSKINPVPEAKTNNSYYSSNEPTYQEQKAVNVSIHTLLHDYKNNEVAADEKYRGKTIKLNGKIEGIKKDFMDKPYVVLTKGGEYEFENVHCSFASTSDVASLNKGETVSIIGKVSGLVMGSVMMENCSVFE